jgi:hypothetical protein
VHTQVQEFARLPLSLLTRLRLILLGHEDLVGIVFWAALVGFCGALASIAFREGIHLFEILFTGQAISLVHAASDLVWWHRALVPPLGAALAGLVLHFAGRRLSVVKPVDYMEAILVGDGKIGLRLGDRQRDGAPLPGLRTCVCRSARAVCLQLGAGFLRLARDSARPPGATMWIRARALNPRPSP